MSAAPEPGLARDVYDLLTGDEDARVCTDIPDSACREQPGNFLKHVTALSATKCGDRLASPKLVLAWLLTQLGAPGYLLGLLVPVRESLALVPQLFVAARLRAVPVRKGFWVAGSVVQGLAVAGMAVTALTLRGASAGWCLIGLLVVFSLARGVCSVAAKDVLGKTIARTRRGSVSGYAASVSGAVVLAVGAAGLLPGVTDGALGLYAGLLAAAAGLWFLAALVYAQLAEQPGATEGGGDAGRQAFAQLRLLREDAQLRRFLFVRAGLLSTALVAPFYTALASESAEGGAAGLGGLLLASGAASFLAAPLWGRFADRSSRRVLVAAGGLAGLTGWVTALLAGRLPAEGATWFLVGAWFLLSVAHGGVRLGRKTYLVDMATEETRASYVAVSNTLIGILLLVGGALVGGVALWGPRAAIATLASVSLLAAIGAWRMEEAA